MVEPEVVDFRVGQMTEGLVGAEVDRNGMPAVLLLDVEEYLGADQGAEREGERLR